jgi:hypothetical protein
VPQVGAGRDARRRLVALDEGALPEPAGHRVGGEEELEVVAAEHPIQAGDVEPPQGSLPQLVAFQLADHVAGELMELGEDLGELDVDRPQVVDGSVGLHPDLDLLLDASDVVVGARTPGGLEAA